MTDSMSDAPARRSDGERSHVAILEAAMRLASVEGLGSLTFGRLAGELGLTKSGVAAHFDSRQHLQQETIAAAQHIFDREVLEPGLAAGEGIAQLERVCAAYLSYLERGVFAGGCFFAQLLAEFDAPSGPIHDAVAEGQRGWLGLLEGLAATARQRGEIGADVDPTQLAFELYAPLELANFLAMLYRDTSMIDRGRAAVRDTMERARHAERG